MPEGNPILSVNVADLPWRPSTVASARFPLHRHERPQFLFILEGELVQAGWRMGPGWASVAGAGTIDEDVHSETGCVFVLVDHA